MQHTHANLAKFAKKRTLPNKRRATLPILELVEQRLQEKGAKNFFALVMPSPNMHDVNVLRNFGVPDCNIQVIENNSRFFAEIRQQCSCGMTDGPLDVETRLACLRDNRFRFDWMNFDLCGPVNRKLFRVITASASYGLLLDGAIVSATAKCARENPETQVMIRKLCGCFPLRSAVSLQERRELALEAIFTCCVPQISQKCRMTGPLLKAIYREDRTDRGQASLMLTFAQQYSVAEIQIEKNHG